ncbi:unnamed protein product [Spirodela intermedia]|uniref:GTD-binding domain-containing protein n=1 Tax=Spirodela intermedia TaxID=51605 RepID=A0A7I8L1Z6_SPIIN|nr:unnamed protein product [Spirodela intermedia]
MAPRNSVRGQSVPSQSISAALSSAVAEWLVIFLLFLDGLLSYLVKRFARYSNLQTPCLLCSSLDRILAAERPGFCHDLICQAHKLEIASTISNDHPEVGEASLLSHAAERVSSSGTFKSQVGKMEGTTDNPKRLSADTDSNSFEAKIGGDDLANLPLLEREYSSYNVQRSLKSELIFSEINELGVASSVLAGHHLPYHGDGSTKKKEKASGSPVSSRIGDHLPHIGYTEVKVTSDSESEMLPSDDDDGGATVGTNDVEEGVSSQSPQVEDVLSRSLEDDVVSEKQMHTVPLSPEHSCLIPMEESEVLKHEEGALLVRRADPTHGLEELNWTLIGEKDHSSLQLKPTSESTVSKGEFKIPFLVILGAGSVSPAPSVEAANDSNPTGTESIHVPSAKDPGSSMLNHMDLNDAYKMAIGSSMNQGSPRDSHGVSEELRLLMSHISASRGPEISWGEMSPSPRVYGQGEDLKVFDASVAIVQRNLSRKFSIERNESSTESLDGGSIISEIEGESPVDRLKRQIDFDWKSMTLLYKELEEERNASAIAANQAMAMITRLQEEKASMQMEALQYQRMMEEQSEYDQEALQRLNDALTQKEVELEDLKVELERCGKLLRDEPLPPKVTDNSEQTEGKSVDMELFKASNGEKTLECSGKDSRDVEGDERATPMTSTFSFDDEKQYISECLRRLEKKLRSSNNDPHVDASGSNVGEDGPPYHTIENSDFSVEGVGERHDTEQGHWDEKIQKDSNSGENVLCEQDESSFPGESSQTSGPTLANVNDISKLREFDNGSAQSSVIQRIDLSSFENEVLHLNERLKTLEADRSFLEHIVNSLRNESGAVQFVQEIACHLRELRRIGVRRRDQTMV